MGRNFSATFWSTTENVSTIDTVISKFEAEIQQHQGFTQIKLIGIIDEDNEFSSLVNRVHGEVVIIDLAEVQDINNCGVRDWVNFLEELIAKGIFIALIECSPAIVAKLNSVTNFVPEGFIKSFYIPYYCPACETEKALLKNVDELYDMSAVSAPTCRCDSCDSVMVFDDLEEAYFRFLTDLEQQPLSDQVRGYLERIAPTLGQHKIISWTSFDNVSTFTNIPSTTSSHNTGFGMSSSSARNLSVDGLRRLRNKAGLRTKRGTVVEQNLGFSLGGLGKARSILWGSFAIFLLLLMILTVLYLR